MKHKLLHLGKWITIIIVCIAFYACKEDPFCMQVFDATIKETGEKFTYKGSGLYDIVISGRSDIDTTSYMVIDINCPDTCKVGIPYSFQDTTILARYWVTIKTDSILFYHKYETEITEGELTLISSSNSLQEKGFLDIKGYELQFSMQFTDEDGKVRTIEDGYAHVCSQYN